MSFIKYFCFLLLIPTLSYAADFKTLWWNIGFHHKQTHHDLDRNLVSLSQNGYDVIGLGEVILKNFSQQTIDILKDKYPHRIYKKYGIRKKNGFWILSKHQFSFQMEPISWTPVGYSKSEEDGYINQSIERYSRIDSFDRKQIQLDLFKDGKAYHIIFYHLSNPWPALVSKTSKYSAAWEILTGTKNPVTNQISHLRENLKDHFGPDYKTERVIIMGDSNCPRKVKNLATSCYRNLLKTLPAVLDPSRSFTYPASEKGDYQVRIDHAQASKSFSKKSLRVLKLQGSDHYPLSLFLTN